MKFKEFLLLIIAVAFFSACQSKKTPELMLENASSTNRTDEPVTLTRNQLAGYIGAIPDGMDILLKDQAGDTIPCQMDDINGDGNWDELFFLVNMKANSKLEVYVHYIDPSKAPVYKSRAHINFAEAAPPYKSLLKNPPQRMKTNDSPSTTAAFQLEGPAWENDKVAFRNYYDARNGMDIFGKKTDKMVMDSVGTGGVSYHELHDWGMDILKVGNSLGAGSIALKIGDNYFRPALADSEGFKMIANGPLRAVFDLTFNGWKVEGRNYNLTHRISIWGGANYYQSEVTVRGLKGDETLVTGIVNMHSDTLYVTEHNPQYLSIATHAHQAFDGEILGMALMLPRADFIKTITAPNKGEGIIETYMADMKISENVPITFRFYSAWEYQDTAFKDWENFKALLQHDADVMQQPIKISGM